jgi:putative membrane protein
MIVKKHLNRNVLQRVSIFFVVFYAVGVIGITIPETHPLFIKLVPLTLLMSAIGLFFYHKFINLKKEISLLIIICLLGYSIEAIGVKSGLIFGNYIYGNALGIKLFETPLLIGINWLFLIYTATSITEKLKIKKWFAIFVAPAFMLVYDVVLEQVAPKMDMWNWHNSEVPLKNYIAWYIIAFSFVLLLKAFKIKTSNPLSAILFICQFLFFTALTFLL